METFDENPTTRTRMILEELRKQEDARQAADEKMKELIEQQVKTVADSIDAFRAEIKKRDHWLVRLWVWVKKVLSFAHSEAEKIRLNE